MIVRALLLTCSLLWSTAAAQSETPPSRPAAIDPAGRPGALVIGGGGGLPDEVYELFLALAGGLALHHPDAARAKAARTWAARQATRSTPA